MSRSRKKVLQYKDRINVYISELVDEEILEFLNKQSDLTAIVMSGLIKLYQDNGNIDLVNYLPRTYSANSTIPALLFENNNQNNRTVPVVGPQSDIQKVATQSIPNQTPIRTEQTVINQEEGQAPSPSIGSGHSAEVNDMTGKQSAFMNNASVGNMANFAANLNRKKDNGSK